MGPPAGQTPAMTKPKDAIEGIEDLLAGAMIVTAVMILALTDNIDGNLALFSIMSVGAALGVYRSVGRIQPPE